MTTEFSFANYSNDSIFSEFMSVNSVTLAISELNLGYQYHPLPCALVSSTIVALSGILPMWLLPIDGGQNTVVGSGQKLMLSFAVGCLLGDVFLHMLPECWSEPGMAYPTGLWVLCGIMAFSVLEKAVKYCESIAELNEPISDTKTSSNNINNNKVIVGMTNRRIQASGYCNLVANVLDNFGHGLSVGGSYCISFRIGLITTAAILLHEIPHEVADFAILLKSGFTRWGAAKAQLGTAIAGLFGSFMAVMFGGQGTTWVQPFTAGGFIYIALVTVLPEILQEKCPKESFKQVLSLLLGILLMAFLAKVQ